jgi:hypothetical protein
MKKPGEKDEFPGGKAERRFRLFEASRGLFRRRTLPLDEERPVEEPDRLEDEEGARDEQEGEWR